MSEIKYGRKIKGIKMELNDFMESWLETLPKEIRSTVSANTIITGGCIASMLMGDKVNDYDVYFRDLATTKLVAEYYVEKFNELNATLPTERTKPYKPEVLVQNLKNVKGLMEERVVVYIKSAGIAGEEPTETYQYFEQYPDGQKMSKFVEDLTENLSTTDDPTKEKYRPVFLSQNAITLSHKAQIVIRFYGEPDKIHDNYDFVHATCYYDYGSKVLHTPAEALLAMMSHELIYRGSLYPIASIFRMKKFLERGWRITAGQQLKIMWQISEIDLKDPVILKEQLTGVDQAYMYQLIDALKNVDSDKINSSYVAEIIDRIF